MAGTLASARTPVTWVWTDAALGALYALPAGAVSSQDPREGAAMAVGVLPAAILDLAPARRARLFVVVVGVLFGLALLAGSVLANVPVVAVAGVLFAGLGAAALGRVRPRLGQLAMALALPVMGVGLSYDDVGQAAGLAALIVGGSLYACGVGLLWSERPAAARAAAESPAPSPSLDYGVRLGGAGATAGAIGLALSSTTSDGRPRRRCSWRPAAEMRRIRSAGRIAAVAAGASLAVLLVSQRPAAGWLAALTILAVAAAATRTSRWYITGGFTTFLVFVLLLYADPQAAGSRLGERIGETVLGVAIAYIFGLGIPMLRRASGQPRTQVP